MCQPPQLMGRESGEHWAGRLYMRRISIHATRVFLRLGFAPNWLTAAMTVTGVVAGAVLLVPGLPGAVACALLVQLYLLLDCSDGEVARWTRRTSVQGVYLDRLGHYFSEAALMVGLGFRAAEGQPTGYAVLGSLAALGVVLIKAETDLVDVARARAGIPAASEDSTQLRSPLVGRIRRFARGLRIHSALGATEASILLLVAALVDYVRDDLAATRFLIVFLAALAAGQLVLHLASILWSRRLR